VRHIPLENDPYFFTNKNGHVMAETNVFKWYGIKDGDVIEIIQPLSMILSLCGSHVFKHVSITSYGITNFCLLLRCGAFVKQ